MYGRYTSEQLKKIAMGTMFLDHAAVAVIYNHGLDAMSPLLENIGLAMRLIGRMAFPLYAFLLVQGVLWTRDWRKYVARVALFALVSEIPYNLVAGNQMWYLTAQNTMVTLMIGLLCMKLLACVEQRFGVALGAGGKIGRAKMGSGRGVSDWLLGLSLALWIAVGGMFVAEVLNGDYGMLGVLLILVLYLFRYRSVEQLGFGCMVLVLMYNFSLYTLFAWIAFFFISRYNGERGRKLGLVPYVFYPVHLLAVWLMGELVVGILV